MKSVPGAYLKGRVGLNGTEFNINTTPQSDYHISNYHFTALKKGGFIVVWTERTTPAGWYCRWYEDDGTPVGNPWLMFSLHITQGLRAGNSSIVATQDGGFIVAMSGTSSTSSSGGYFSKFNKNETTATISSVSLTTLGIDME